jgi:hypothetical protein
MRQFRSLRGARALGLSIVPLPVLVEVVSVVVVVLVVPLAAPLVSGEVTGEVLGDVTGAPGVDSPGPAVVGCVAEGLAGVVAVGPVEDGSVVVCCA